MSSNEEMDFKFSCKWFELEFSGDPGFVQTQLTRYEPFIKTALTRLTGVGAEPDNVEEKTGDAQPEKPAPKTSPEPERRRPEPKPSIERKENKSDPGPRPHEVNRRDDRHREDRLREDRPRPEPAKSDMPSFASSDFPSRRRAPRIDEDKLRKVFEAKKPRTHHDRVMVFGYYMEHQGDGSDFTVEEIKHCYRAAGQEEGTNIEQVISHATRSGFILRSDQGRGARYKLSSKGVRYVEDGLKLA